MIKLIAFDLDGVLIDAKEIHYLALNEALGEEYAISEIDHHNIYDGRKTKEKLVMLTEQKGLPVELYDNIYNKKQQITIEKIVNLQLDHQLIDLFKFLKQVGYKIAVCSNSIRRTVLTAVSKIGLMEYCDLVLSNEDVKNSKPHPEIYWKAMSIIGVLPEETIIIEDSPPGLLAAHRSTAKYLRVTSPKELTIDRISNKIVEETNMAPKIKWSDKNLNIVIPMAGAGSRFATAGYTFPKPLIDVNGKPMIQVVVENLGLDGNYIFIVQKDHREKYNLDNMLKIIAPNCKIVETDGLTEGAAATVLLAKNYIDNNNPLFLSNSDQFVEWDSVEFMYHMQETYSDGGIVTFKATHPKWSFAKINEHGIVQEVAEKNPISDNATVGFYYWKHGKDFCKYADKMIEQNIRVNNEFYVCPVFNQAIADGKVVRTNTANKMWGLGTPEDLEFFLKEYHIT